VTRSHRIRSALRRRLHGPYAALEGLDTRLGDVQTRLTNLERATAAAGEVSALAREMHELLHGEVRPILRALVAEEAANRRRLYSLRETADYDSAWTAPAPLVTVTVATRSRPKLLAERSLPSILAQTHGDLEVIVVGDDADDATAAAVSSLGDRRVLFRNLTQRLEFTDDENSRWLVAATLARNEAMRLATGSWVVCFDDDDAMVPDCVERLLARAREGRFEAVYGRAAVHMTGRPDGVIGAFPPQLGDFTWASGMYHAGLRFFARELIAADLGLPGDWYVAQRMLRAGVRFGWVGEILADYYPSHWNDPESAD
jgi:O-antigen biosynthesis protein